MLESILSIIRNSNHVNDDCSIRVFDCHIREYRSNFWYAKFLSPTLKTPLYLMFTTEKY